MLLSIKERAAAGARRRESTKQSSAVELMGAILSRYPVGIVCTHQAHAREQNTGRVCFCAYGFPSDMNANDTGEMNAFISAYNRIRRLDLPLLRRPADS